MQTNFKILVFRDVEIERREIDLHNNYDFVGYEFEAFSKSFIMKFKKLPDERVPASEYDLLAFVHKRTSFVHINCTTHDEFPEDSMTLGEITFYPSAERDENCYFLERESPCPTDDIIYYFENGTIVRVGCEEIVLER